MWTCSLEILYQCMCLSLLMIFFFLHSYERLLAIFIANQHEKCKQISQKMMTNRKNKPVYQPKPQDTNRISNLLAYRSKYMVLNVGEFHCVFVLVYNWSSQNDISGLSLFHQLNATKPISHCSSISFRLHCVAVCVCVTGDQAENDWTWKFHFDIFRFRFLSYKFAVCVFVCLFLSI